MPQLDGLRVALVLQSLAGKTMDNNTWAGLGFGDYMLNPNTFFTVMQRTPSAPAGITLQEYKSMAAYRPPVRVVAFRFAI